MILVQENIEANDHFEKSLDRLIADHARLERENIALKARLERRENQIVRLESRLETVRKAVAE